MNRYDEKMASLDTWYQRPDLEREFRKSQVHATEAQLRQVELELSSPLPPDYREFLRDYSGHIFHNTVVFPLKNESVKVGGVKGFFGIDHELISMYREASESDWPVKNYKGLTLIRAVEELEVFPDGEGMLWALWPTELLPIAFSANDTTCLVISGENSGRVCYWPNDPCDDQENVYLVANSFDEFMQLLQLPSSE